MKWVFKLTALLLMKVLLNLSFLCEVMEGGAKEGLAAAMAF